MDDFLVEPTRDLDDWRWLWTGDRRFPIRSHRGFWGRLVVGFKRLFGPLVKTPQNDLWERQRVFNLILLEHLARLRDLDLEDRLAYLEGFQSQGVQDLMAHNDALFARVDQKLDRQSRRVRDLLASLGDVLARVETPDGGTASAEDPAVGELSRGREEDAYLELERRFRGTEEEIRERLQPYLPRLRDLPGPVLDLGCGRGEALEIFDQHGIQAQGVDASARMVAACREKGLEVREGNLFEVLAGTQAGSLGGIVSFHVVEHLPARDLDRLVRLAHGALAPEGVLALETPNPLSLVAGGRNFWIDPTHRRPVHPRSLELLYELAGFDDVEVLELRPFPPDERLPEIDVGSLPKELRALAHEVNRLRDRLDQVLYGHQDFAVLGRRPAA